MSDHPVSTHPFKLVSTLFASPPPDRELSAEEAFELLKPIYGEEAARAGMADIREGRADCMSVWDAMVEFNASDKELAWLATRLHAELPGTEEVDKCRWMADALRRRLNYRNK